MGKWVVRAHYPSGDVVEEFPTQGEAHEAQQKHRDKAEWISLGGPAPADATVPDRCSFCGKERSQVGRMVAGPAGAGVAICDQCVALSCKIIWGSAPGG